MRLEFTILKNLIQNEDYFRKVLPFLKDEYFTDSTERIIFHEIQSFSATYSKPAPVEAIELAVKEKKNLTDGEVEKSGE